MAAARPVILGAYGDVVVEPPVVADDVIAKALLPEDVVAEPASEQPAAAEPEPAPGAGAEPDPQMEPGSATVPAVVVEPTPPVGSEVIDTTPPVAPVSDPPETLSADAEVESDFILDLDPIAPVAVPQGYEVSESSAEIAAMSCDDCVYVTTCPNKDERDPSSCGSFQWK